MQYNLRRAIWKAHNKKCYYCDEYVSIRELQIDHFIPKSTDTRVKEALLEELKLDTNFDFNCLKNLVPSHSSCNNNRKGNYVPTAKSFSGLLVITEKILPKISKIKEQLDHEEKHDENISKIKSYVEAGQASAEDLFNYLNNEDVDFEEVESFEHHFIRASTKNVMIQCFLPRFPDLYGSMLITFRSLRVRDCLITFNHSEIVNQIFQGRGSSPEAGHRSFIVHCDVSKESSVVQLGNNRFTLSLDEVRQLCKLVDKIAPVYIETFQSIESIFKTRDFTYSKNGRFRLIKISRSLWKEILKFAAEHDYGNGTTEWHIFDGKARYLKIYCTTHEDSNKDYRSFIYPEAVDDGLWDNFTASDNEVWLCWEPSILIDNENDRQRIKNNLVWSADYTYNWVIKHLIPAVIQNRLDKNRPLVKKLFGRRRKLPIPFGKHNSYSTEMTVQSPFNFKDIETFKKWVNEVQSFFAVYSKHYLTVDAIRGVYEAILTCLQHFKLDEGTLEYIKVKLDGDRSIESLITSVEEKMKDLSKGKGINGGYMEYALRPLCAILNEGNYEEQKEAIIVPRLRYFLESLWKEYRFLSDLERAREL